MQRLPQFPSKGGYFLDQSLRQYLHLYFFLDEGSDLLLLDLPDILFLIIAGLTQLLAVGLLPLMQLDLDEVLEDLPQLI